MKTISPIYLVSAFLLMGCNSTASRPPQQVLTLKASVNNGTMMDVSPPHYELPLPNIGDIGTVTAFEGSDQVKFSLVPTAQCAGIVAISPSEESTQQTVTAIGAGKCFANVKAADGSVSVLTVSALPLP